MGHIYKIQNNINNKTYIGKTEYDDPNKRWLQHLLDMNKRDYENRPLYNAMKKYGVDNFTFTVLFSNLYGEELSDKEIELIHMYDTYKNGYNATLGGDSRLLYSDEDIRNIAKEYVQGVSIKELSLRFNIDSIWLSVRMKALGYNINENGSYQISKNNTPIRMSKGDFNQVFLNSKECINFIIDNEISKNSYDTIRKGMGKALSKSRKTYLGYTFDRIE